MRFLTEATRYYHLGLDFTHFVDHHTRIHQSISLDVQETENNAGIAKTTVLKKGEMK